VIVDLNSRQILCQMHDWGEYPLCLRHRRGDLCSKGEVAHLQFADNWTLRQRYVSPATVDVSSNLLHISFISIIAQDIYVSLSGNHCAVKVGHSRACVTTVSYKKGLSVNCHVPSSAATNFSSIFCILE